MDRQDVRPGQEVETAIARVLAAEHAARAAVEAAAAAATARVEAARATAQAQAERTERRIRSVRSAFEARTAAAVATLEAAADLAATVHEPGSGDDARLDAAIAALAARIVRERA